MSVEKATCPECKNPEAGFDPSDGDFHCPKCGFESHPADAPHDCMTNAVRAIEALETQ